MIIPLRFTVDVGPKTQGFPLIVSVYEGGPLTLFCESLDQVTDPKCMKMIVGTGLRFENEKTAFRYIKSVLDDFTAHMNKKG